jgi:hypothetical protein
MDFRHLIVTCLFSKLRLPFDNQKVKENYAIFSEKRKDVLGKTPLRLTPNAKAIFPDFHFSFSRNDRSIPLLPLYRQL